MSTDYEDKLFNLIKKNLLKKLKLKKLHENSAFQILFIKSCHILDRKRFKNILDGPLYNPIQTKLLATLV
jgi:hypothetical protein